MTSENLFGCWHAGRLRGADFVGLLYMAGGAMAAGCLPHAKGSESARDHDPEWQAHPQI